MRNFSAQAFGLIFCRGSEEIVFVLSWGLPRRTFLLPLFGSPDFLLALRVRDDRLEERFCPQQIGAGRGAGRFERGQARLGFVNVRMFLQQFGDGRGKQLIVFLFPECPPGMGQGVREQIDRRLDEWRNKVHGHASVKQSRLRLVTLNPRSSATGAFFHHSNTPTLHFSITPSSSTCPLSRPIVAGDRPIHAASFLRCTSARPARDLCGCFPAAGGNPRDVSRPVPPSHRRSAESAASRESRSGIRPGPFSTRWRACV